MKRLILNARVLTPTAVLPDYCLEITGGRITALTPCAQQQAWDADTEVFDACGAYVAPGLIDLHIHGTGGFGPELGTTQALLDLSVELARHGVTAFSPTLYCGKPADMCRILENTVRAFGQEKGAQLLGYHLEGPFISPQKPGVMKPEDIAPIDLQQMQALWQAAQGRIIQMTVAPELPGLAGLAAFCQEHHILLQAGHTNATYAEFLCGAQLGITHATHLFNAMRGFTHREPGAAGAVLLHPEISTEIIADGVHVHPDVVQFVTRIKPIENIVLITDALRPTAQAKPPFLANGEEVVFDGGVWKRQSDGVIAGSGLTLLQAVQNMVRWGLPLPQAVACASFNPARRLGLGDRGEIALGKRADLVVFDQEFQVQKTFLA